MNRREKSEFDVLKRIDSERAKRNWSEYTLAKNSGLPQSTISTWTRKNLQPSVASIEKICRGLGISLSQFFSEDNPESVLTDEQRRLFEVWSCLQPSQREATLLLLKSFIEDSNQ